MSYLSVDYVKNRPIAQFCQIFYSLINHCFDQSQLKANLSHVIGKKRKFKKRFHSVVCSVYNSLLYIYFPIPAVIHIQYFQNSYDDVNSHSLTSYLQYFETDVSQVATVHEFTFLSWPFVLLPDCAGIHGVQNTNSTKQIREFFVGTN